jgi:hypothetical protein
MKTGHTERIFGPDLVLHLSLNKHGQQLNPKQRTNIIFQYVRYVSGLAAHAYLTINECLFNDK